MRSALIVAWLLAPLAAGAVHFYGPGEQWMTRDEVALLIAKGDAHAEAREYSKAIQSFDLALQKLPPEAKERGQRIRLARAHARMYVGGLPEAHEELGALLDELSSDPKSSPGLVADTRAALATSQHYMTWLLRLEGFPETEWGPYIEGARQNFKLLAEGADAKGAADVSKRMKEDLDSSIRLARMDLSDLQALPLPSQ